MELMCADCKTTYPLKKKHFCHNQIVLIPPVKEMYWYKGLFGGDSIVSLRILGYLDAKNVCMMSTLSRKWYTLTQNKYLWRYLFRKTFGPNLKNDGSWKNSYIKVYLARLLDESPNTDGIAIMDLFENYNAREYRREWISKFNVEEKKHYDKNILDAKQEEIALQLALQLSMSENQVKEVEPDLLDGPVEFEIVPEDDDVEDPVESEVDASDEIHTSDFCSSVEASPLDQQQEFISFKTNNTMYK
jgi:hypothetical protein